MGADSDTKPTDAGSGSGTIGHVSPGNTKTQQAGEMSDPKKCGKDDSDKTPQIQSDKSDANNSPESNPVSSRDSKNTNNNANVSLDDKDNEDDDPYSDSKDDLLTMNFNQDGGCLAVGTGSGFRICNVSPFQETFRRRLGGAEKGVCDHTSLSDAAFVLNAGLICEVQFPSCIITHTYDPMIYFYHNLSSRDSPHRNALPNQYASPHRPHDISPLPTQQSPNLRRSPPKNRRRIILPTKSPRHQTPSRSHHSSVERSSLRLQLFRFRFARQSPHGG